VNARKPLPAELDPRGFHVRDARLAGVASHRLRAADLDAPFYGGRSAGDDRLAALLPLMARNTVFSGPTAAKIWGLPLPLRLTADETLHVSSLGNRRMRRAGVVSSRREHGDVRLVRGLPVLDPSSTWMSLGRLLGTDDLTAVADRIITGTIDSPPLASVDDLDTALADAGSARFIRQLRAARVEARAGAWSRPETLLRLLIVRAGLPEPVLNAAVVVEDGGTLYPDLSWPEYRIVIEYDGHWHGRQGRWTSDSARHERLVDAGWMVVRVQAGELFDHPQAVIARLARRLQERGHVPARLAEESQMISVAR
jgi:hypothetical protein